jgi:uncharacterized protein YjbJ (UPF0337 family)
MISQAENGRAQEVSNRVFSGLHKAKDILTQATDTLKETTQQAKVSLAEPASKAVDSITVATDKAVDITSDTLNTITATAQQAKASLRETIEQTKGSLEQTLQTTGQIKTTASETIQTAISSSVSDWLQDHPAILRLVQMLVWATNHPILSLVIFLFTLASAWSLIKAVGRLFEIAGLSILQAPFKLSKLLIQASSRSLSKLGNLTLKPLVGATETSVLQTSESETAYQDKQQRLLEISSRLEKIGQEQSDLLQEAILILNSDLLNLITPKDKQYENLSLKIKEKLLKASSSNKENDQIIRNL